jgi:hypothetical protein
MVNEHPKKDLALANNKILRNCPNLKKIGPKKRKKRDPN